MGLRHAEAGSDLGGVDAGDGDRADQDSDGNTAGVDTTSVRKVN
ncbi:hypothetical protein [Saccharopolyspora sp. NPDC002376]